MTEKTETEFQFKCSILADVWLEYRDEPEWRDYLEYNDLGLPLAYMIANGVVPAEGSEIGHPFINEAFSLLLEGLEIEKDYGFYELQDLLELSDKEVGEFGGKDPEGDSDLDSEEDEEDSEDSEASEWEQGWNTGYSSGYLSGVFDEQERIQELCSTYTEMYLSSGKGQKAVLWREVADALKPIDLSNIPTNEEDGF